MANGHIIYRAEQVRWLKKLLREKRIVYLSCFFYSGKTVLLNQLSQSLKGSAQRFDAAKDDWLAFESSVRENQSCVLLIDSLQAMTDPMALEALATYLSNLPEGQTAVLAGRAQLPPGLETLCQTGVVHVLDNSFVLFSEEEIRQLFLDYGLDLKPADIAYLKTEGWGWPSLLHNIAMKLLNDSSKSVRSVRGEVSAAFWDILIRDVFLDFPESDRLLLFKLAPFERFSEEMAKVVTGRSNAPEMMSAIARKSYMLRRESDGCYAFIPFVRHALFHEMQARYDQEYIDEQYRRAALYFELQNRVPEAVHYFAMLKDTRKIRELLILNTHTRPANGDYVELKSAYDLLDEKDIEASPELMKGMCMIESLSGRIDESERWYEALRKFIRTVPAKDARRRTAQEAIAYLDIGLAHRGTKDMLRILTATAKQRLFTDSDSWHEGFNIAGNSVSLINGGKDFSRWVPHGQSIYRLFKAPIEMAVGRAGRGLGDVAIAECMLESDTTGEYDEAMRMVLQGQSRLTDDLELQVAATGIQCRILAAMGQAERAGDVLRHCLDSLPERAPRRMRQNLEIVLLTFRLMGGETGTALDWLETCAPDETQPFNILDRYGYMLKLRLYILTARWDRIPLLAAQLANYFERYDRPYMRTQLHLLQALANRRSGKKDWKPELEAALTLARRYRLTRVVADEGAPILGLLTDTRPAGKPGRRSEPDDPWLAAVLALTRKQAANYPRWMQSVAVRPNFTDREYQVYTLLIAGNSNAQICEALHRQERTIKRNLTDIYAKLGVKTRTEALAKAAELGDI